MDKNLEDLRHIRSMMERSTKFLSVSGLAGIGAGIVALIAAYLANEILWERISVSGVMLYDLVVLAILTVIIAASCGLYFSISKAKKNNSKFWTAVSVQILKDFAVPMISGGLLCIAMIYHGSALFIPATMLIFYGLALISAGARTYRDVKMLGACEIILGLLAAIFIRNGLIFWAIGFGALHIIYGAIMYWRYDRKSDK